MIREEHVGQHSFGVAMILLILCPGPSAMLLKAALCHDLGELRSGDPSFWAKRNSPALKAATDEIETTVLQVLGLNFEEYLDKEELNWLKAADALHAWLVLYENVVCGNSRMGSLHQNLTNYILAKSEWPPIIATTMQQLMPFSVWQED